MKRVDYDHLTNQLLGAIHTISTGDQGEMAEDLGEFIDFIEGVYIKSVLAMVGSVLMVSKHSADEEAVRVGLEAARELLESSPEHVKDRLDYAYNRMITELNMPDAFQQKTHNEQVSEEIKAEMNRD